MNNIINVKHAGHSGDIIYSLAFANYIAKSNNTKLDFYILNDVKANLSKNMIHPNGENIMNEKSYNFIKPLLKRQSYINEINFISTSQLKEGVIELDFYRKRIGLNLAAGNIMDFPRKVLGYQVNTTSSWLEIEEETKDDFIICAFSRRYRNTSIDYSFLEDLEHVYFIGLEDEFIHFKNKNKLNRIKRVEIDNALQMARIIKKSKLFMGNQSFAFSIAEALKVDRLLEVCEICPNVIPTGNGAGDYINNISLTRALLEKKIINNINPVYKEPNYTLYYN